MKYYVIVAKVFIDNEDPLQVKVGCAPMYNSGWVTDTITASFKKRKPDAAVKLVIQEVREVSKKVYDDNVPSNFDLG